MNKIMALVIGLLMVIGLAFGIATANATEVKLYEDLPNDGILTISARGQDQNVR